MGLASELRGPVCKPGKLEPGGWRLSGAGDVKATTWQQRCEKDQAEG